MLNVRAILFDADETLFDFERSQREALLESLSLGAESAEAELAFGEYKLINANLWRDYEEGRIDRDALRLRRFELLLARLGPESSPAKDAITLAEDFLANLSRKSYLLPGALETLTELKEKGLILAVASNGFSQVQRGRLELSPIKGLLSFVFISEEMGCQKPEPEFFAKCLEGLDCQASQAIFVGDSPQADVAGAKRAGIFSVWVNRLGASYPYDVPAPDAEIRSVGELPRILGLSLA